MRVSSDEYTRIHNLLQADKSVMSESCKALVLQDFAEKLNEYFDLIGLPRMEILCKNGQYTVHMSFQAERIKRFHVLK
ncbi:MAG: hypothetical protein E7380_05265 [Clostridiales bacterium]|nr:hypothetical protein [Clostridiales bacterium]MBQ2769344.1 hypothetical protein [Clostridia bacterium]